MSPLKKQAKKVKLTNPDTYCWLAIYTPNSDYRLASLMNKILDIKLQREPEVENIGFSIYSDRNTLAPIQFVLIANNTECRKLASQCEQINFFLKISNIENCDVTEIIKKVKEIESVSACALLDGYTKLLSKLNLL